MTADLVPGIRSALRALHIDVGRPAYRALTRQAELAGDDLGTSTIGDLIGKSATGLPRLASVQAFLAACLRHQRANARRGHITREPVSEARFDLNSLATSFPEEFALIANMNKRKARQRSSPPKYRATLREIAARTRSLTGRERELSDLVAFAQSSQGYRLIVGDVWTGKSALLAALCVHLIDNEMNLPVDMVCHFLSRREADAEASKFMAAVIPQLAWLVDDPSAATTIDLIQFRYLWDRAVARAVEEQRHLLLVVDGLDEDLHPSASLSVAAVLPACPGPYAHVLVSSRPHPELPSDLPVGHPLRAATGVTLTPFHGSQERRLLAMQEIDGLVGQEPGELAIDVLGTLAAAGGPLAVEDLAAILYGESPPTSSVRRIRDLISKRAARSLQSAGRVGEPSGVRYQFAHLSLLEHARAHPELSDPDYVRRIHAWAEQCRHHAGLAGDTAGSMFLLDTYPNMLGGRADHQRLAILTGDPDWIVAAILGLGVDVTLAHLRQAMVAAPTDRRVADALATVTGQTFNLRRHDRSLQRGYVLGQLCLQAYELGCDDLAVALRSRIIDQPAALWSPTWTTHVASRTLTEEIGRHAGGINSLAVLGDGKVVSAGYNDSRVLLWDPSNPGTAGSDIGSCDDELISSILVLPDDRIVVGGEAGEGTIRLWDPGTPGSHPMEASLYDGGVISSIALLPDGRIMTSGGGGDFRVLAWDPAKPDAAPIELIGNDPDDRTYHVSAFPDGRFAAVTSSGKIMVYGPSDKVLAVGNHPGASSVRVLRDGRLLTFGSRSSSALQVWGPAAPGEIPLTLGVHGAFQQGVLELPDGRLVTCGINDGRVLLWDLDENPVEAVELGRHDGPGAAAAMLPDGRVVTGGQHDGRMLVWDPQAAPPTVAAVASEGQTTALAVLPDQRVVTCRYHHDRRILLWDPRVPTQGEVHIGDLTWWTQAVTAVPDGRLVVGEFTTGEISLWDLSRTAVAKEVLGRHPGGVKQIVLLDDGRLATTGHASDLMMVWNPDRPDSQPLVLSAFDRAGGYIAGLPDGRIASIDWVTGSVQVRDLSHPRDPALLLGVAQEHAKIAALPDGTVVTCSSDGDILLWDPSTPKQDPRSLGSQPEGTTAIAVLPDGHLVTGSTERAMIWNPDDPSQTTELGCSVAAIAVDATLTSGSVLAIAHMGHGWSLWRQTTPTTIR